MFSSLSTRTLALVAVSAALVLIYVLWRLVVMIINALYDKAPKARVFLPVLLLALALLILIARMMTELSARPTP
jgi:hypothetical protein